MDFLGFLQRVNLIYVNRLTGKCMVNKQTIGM